MALQSLNLSNARITAKPVSGGRTNLNAISQALQSTQQIASTAYSQELINRENQLVEDQKLDLAKVENAVANKEDLNALELATEAGVAYRDETFTTKIVNENSREAQLESAKKGETLKQAQARFDLKTKEDLELFGTPEQKAMSQTKSNALGRQYSNNVFEQEKARITTEKASADKAAVVMALDMEKPPANFSKEQTNEWYAINALQDINVAANDNAVLAAENGWNTEERAAALQESVDQLMLKHENNPAYVNSISKNALQAKNAIISQGATESVARANKMNNQNQVSKAAVFLNNPSEEIGSILNKSISSGQVSVDNAKNAMVSRLREYNQNGQAISKDVLGFLESDRPDGRSGWAYSDPSIAGLINTNERMLKAQSKAANAKDKRTPQEMADYELTMGKRLEEGVASSDDIELGLNQGLITDSKAIGFYKKLSAMKTQNDLNLSVATSLNSSNPVASTIAINTLKTSTNPENLQKSVDITFQDILQGEYGNKEDGVNYSLQEMGQIMLGGNANASKMVQNGLVPKAWKQSFDITYDQSPELFAETASYFQSFKDQVRSDGSSNVSNDDILRGSMTQSQYKNFENYNIVRKANPEITDIEMSNLMANAERIGDGYIESNNPDVSREDFNSSMQESVSDLYDFRWSDYNPFSNAKAINNSGNKNEMAKVLSKRFNEYKILNPGASLEEGMDYAKSYAQQNYMDVDGVLLYKGTTFNETQRAVDYDPYMKDYRTQMANDLLGDKSRGGDISFTMNPNTEKTGIYDVVVQNLDGSSYKMAETRMFFGSENNDNVPSFQNFANGRADIERDIKARQVRKSELEGKNNSKYQILSNDERSSLKDIKAEIDTLESKKDTYNSNFSNKEVANVLVGSPLFQPIMSDKEIEGGYVNIGKRKVNINNLTNEDKFKVAEQSVKKSKQKFVSNTDKEFNKLPSVIQNKLIQNFILQKNSNVFSGKSDSEIIKEIYSTEMKSRDGLTKMYDDLLEEGTYQGSELGFVMGSQFMFGVYGAYNSLKGENIFKDRLNSIKANSIKQQLDGE